MKLKKYVLIIIGFTTSLLLSAQLEDVDKNYYQNSIGKNFFEIQEKMENYYATRDKGRGSGYKQYKRWEDEIKYQLNPDGTIPNLAKIYAEAYEQTKAKGNNKSLTGSWKNVGPFSWKAGPISRAPGIGRINCISFHPSDANTIYLGSPRGGIWKSIDGGEKWTPQFQHLSQIGVSSIVLDPNNASHVYALTGDGEHNFSTTNSLGIYKSTDGGNNWIALTLPWNSGTNVWGRRMVMDPNDSDIMYVATTNGLYKTTNGGTSWNREINNNFFDVRFKPGDSNTIYAATDNDIYVNSGNGWNQTVTNASNSKRIALGVSANAPNTLYYLRGKGSESGDPSFKYGGLYKSTDSGLTFTLQSDTPNILGGNPLGAAHGDQSTYDTALLVDKDNDDKVLVGGINLWGSNNSGDTMSIKAYWAGFNDPSGAYEDRYVHADIHALEINPLDGKVYCGSDGGIFVSTNFGETWTDLSKTLAVSQIYDFDGAENHPDYLIAGFQDNGSMLYRGEQDSTLSIYQADGQDCKIHPTNKDTIIYSTQSGAFYRTFDGGQSHTMINPASSTRFYVPLEMDPTNPNRLALGYKDDIYISENLGDTWTSYKPDGIKNQLWDFILISPDGTEIFASKGSKIFKAELSNLTTWTDISYNLPSLSGVPITSISMRDNNDNLYVTMGGSAVTSKVYVLRQSAPSTRVNYTFSGLPNVGVLCQAFDKNNVHYIGTTVGIYVRSLGGTSWINFSSGISNASVPNQQVRDIEINNTKGVIYAATYGRGIFESGLYGACVEKEFLTQSNDIDNENPGTQYVRADEFIEATRIINGSASNNVKYQAGQTLVFKPGFHAKQNAVFEAAIGDCTVSEPPN